jgi:hypothetical protein
MDNLTPGQIGQLVEIDRAREKRGLRGIYAEVAALINRLTDGAAALTSSDPRISQAKRLWDKGFGENVESFDVYLAGIPEIPEKLLANDERFPLLVLADARLGITKSCELAGLKYGGNDQTFEDFDPKKARNSQVYWMRCQGGRRNRGKSVKACRDSFAKGEIGLTAMEGVALYVQNPEVIKGDFLDLPSSVRADGRDRSAYLSHWDDGPELCWLWYDDGHPYYGSASRRE